MGRVKDYLMEMEEAWVKGYHASMRNEKFVCAKHFPNKYQQRYINDNGSVGSCSYCGQKAKVIDLSDFIEYAGSRVTAFVGPIDDEGMYLANSFLDKDEQNEEIPGWCIRGQYIAPSDAEYYEDVEKVMNDFDLVTDNHELNEEIASCFNVNQWIRKDPTTALPKDDWMQSWLNFSHQIKTRQRYTFFRSQEYYQGSGFIQGLETDIVAEVSNMVRELEHTICVGTKLYRGRPDDEQSPFTTFESLTAPPAVAAKENRMSPYGISMFYGSFDKDTPIREIQNYLDDKSKKIYVGEFEVTKALKVINLCNIPSPDFWMDGEDDWQRYAFLHAFHQEISKPTGENDPKIEYIPSQVFCEYLRFIQVAKDGSAYNGIIYRSSLGTARNVVLFYDNKTSASVLKLNHIN